MESGELRVVNKAAKQHWDFTKDNTMQLQRHLHDLRFPETSNGGGYNGGNSPTSTPAILVRVGLTNLNNSSMENLTASAMQDAT